MNVIRSFRNLDRHGQQRAPEVIEEELRQLEPHLARFREDLVRLEVVASQTRGKKRIKVSLRLQLPSGVIAAREEGFEIEPVLRKAFADLRRRVDRKVALLKGEPQWKRPARRARIKALLPPARDRAEAERRTLYFGLIENNLDAVYDTVRRELIYLEANGSVREGLLNVGDLVDTTILKGLERFEQRLAKFSTGDWLTRLAFETIDASAREASHALPDSGASLDAAPEAPAQDPTEADQEMFEFYQPDDVPRLEDLVADSSAADPEAEAARREEALALHRAMRRCRRSGAGCCCGSNWRKTRRSTSPTSSAFRKKTSDVLPNLHARKFVRRCMRPDTRLTSPGRSESRRAFRSRSSTGIGSRGVSWAT